MIYCMAVTNENAYSTVDLINHWFINTLDLRSKGGCGLEEHEVGARVKARP